MPSLPEQRESTPEVWPLGDPNVAQHAVPTLSWPLPHSGAEAALAPRTVSADVLTDASRERHLAYSGVRQIDEL